MPDSANIRIRARIWITGYLDISILVKTICCCIPTLRFLEVQPCLFVAPKKHVPGVLQPKQCFFNSTWTMLNRKVGYLDTDWKVTASGLTMVPNSRTESSKLEVKSFGTSSTHSAHSPPTHIRRCFPNVARRLLRGCIAETLPDKSNKFSQEGSGSFSLRPNPSGRSARAGLCGKPLGPLKKQDWTLSETIIYRLHLVDNRAFEHNI